MFAEHAKDIISSPRYFFRLLDILYHYRHFLFDALARRMYERVFDFPRYYSPRRLFDGASFYYFEPLISRKTRFTNIFQPRPRPGLPLEEACHRATRPIVPGRRAMHDHPLDDTH